MPGKADDGTHKPNYEEVDLKPGFVFAEEEDPDATWTTVENRIRAELKRRGFNCDLFIKKGSPVRYSPYVSSGGANCILLPCVPGRSDGLKDLYNKYEFEGGHISSRVVSTSCWSLFYLLCVRYTFSGAVDLSSRKPHASYQSVNVKKTTTATQKKKVCIEVALEVHPKTPLPPPHPSHT